MEETSGASKTEEQREKSSRMVIQAVRMVGVFMMLASLVLWFDVMGLSTLLLGGDATLRSMVSGVLLALGALDAFLLPMILAQAINRK